ncbi:hypothetical protein PPERSA_07257 [Pseudocohnilembus persalinus]|uniref:Dynein regulatory complex protein 10 n=1 Tax=Pseudocohnilembus persalinus TaxID=266149 RepID=A0A0V0QD43_PSEPJ|nr:hypothetical protein PPERSA_07257 [Pseudocohnilembus persalinus]|eukprot:KRX00060.1 hypothetical protein PPERSA_07257 [Pseudocohnilembus persalinus]
MNKNSAFTRSFGQKESGIYGSETVTRVKGQNKIQDQHNELIKNIQSTNIGKPTIVEAQRILQIFEGLQFNLQIFQYFDSEFIGKFIDIQKGKLSKELIKQLSQEALEILKEQAEIEAKYKPFATLEQQREEDEEIDEDKLIEKNKIYKQLEKNFQNLTRFFKEHPEDFEIIRELKQNKNSEIKDLNNYIECWKIIYQKKLSTASEEQISQEIQTQNLKERIDRLKQRKESCEKDQRHLRADREQFQKEKKEEMEKLKAEIQEVKQNEIQDQRRLEEEIQQYLTQRGDEHKKKLAEYEKQKAAKEKEFLEEKKNYTHKIILPTENSPFLTEIILQTQMRTLVFLPLMDKLEREIIKIHLLL